MNKFITRREMIRTASAAVALSACSPQSFAETLTVKTQHGAVQGRMLGKACGFLGVPYGGPADGANRFKAPTRPAVWPGIKSCVAAGPRAIQSPGSLFTNADIGPYFSGGRADSPSLTAQPDSENCLVLNVLSPDLKGKSPVMVYMHGGGFTNGSAALTVLSDKFVSEEKIVLVGINHRLNVFGYLYLGGLSPEYSASANQGQLDLIAALEWVRDNIANFGGDPGNVTIFGESGGGGKVSCILAMPQAKGLFHRAIVQSGSTLTVSTADEATANTSKFLAKLGVSPSQLGDLQKLSAAQLFAAIPGAGPLRLGPVVDGHNLPQQPWETKAPPQAAGVDFLVGNCKDEGTLFTRNQDLFHLDWQSLNQQLSKPGTMGASGIPAAAVDEIVAAYRKDYPQESPSDIYFRLSADRAARANAQQQANLKSAQNSGAVFMYHFDWDTPLLGGKLRAFHTADLPLEMRLVAYPESDALSRQLAGAWAAFARTGNPNHAGLPNWEPYSPDKKANMIFDVNQSRLEHDPAAAEMKLLKPFRGGLL
jgi:para-nitrobenzyl esterase